MLIKSAGHVVFAVTMIAFGIMGLIKGGLTPIWQPAPQGVPAQEGLAYLCALVSLATGIGLLWRRTAGRAARVLLAYFLLWLIVFRVRDVFPAPTVVGSWYGCAETAVMMAAVWVLYVRFAEDWDKQRLAFATGDRGLRIARTFYGIALIFFGVAHFVYLKETVADVPGWLPWHTGWAYLTGSTFIAAGLALLVALYARLAAALSALQIGTLTLLVWVPVVAAGTANAFQRSETMLSAALTAAAWVVADSYRAKPWLTVRCKG